MLRLAEPGRLQFGFRGFVAGEPGCSSELGSRFGFSGGADGGSTTLQKLGIKP